MKEVLPGQLSTTTETPHADTNPLAEPVAVENLPGNHDTLKSLYEISRSPADSPIAIKISNREIIDVETRRQIEEKLRAIARKQIELESAEESRKLKEIISMAKQYDFIGGKDGWLSRVNATQDSFIKEINLYVREYKKSGLVLRFQLSVLLRKLKKEFEQFEKYRLELIHLSVELKKILAEEKNEDVREKFVRTQAMLKILEDLRNKIDTISDKREIPIITKGNLEGVAKYVSDIHPFMIKLYKEWDYDEEGLNIIEQVVGDPNNIHIDQDMPLEEMTSLCSNEESVRANQTKAGEIYLNSESVDFENAKIFIPEIPETVKKLGTGAVMKYIHETYKESYVLPDIRYYQYLAELFNKYKAEKSRVKKKLILKQIPERFRNGDAYFFPGSMLVTGSGYWMVPNIYWEDRRLVLDADDLGLDWDAGPQALHIVLFEK